MAASKQSVVIIGSGWAGATLSSTLDEQKYSITVVSPETTTSYTPLLASAACGYYDFSLVESPIRKTDKLLNFIQARVEDIDFGGKMLKCTPAFPDLIDQFSLSYDIVVVAPGCTNHTFGTPGVSENALFVRNTKDAKVVAGRIQDLFERASLPGLTEQQQMDILHFIIVGGGPTGVEMSSELSDLFSGHYAKMYPHLKGKVSVAIHDVAPAVLSPFDSKLQEYAMSSFAKRNVEVLTGSHIEKVERDCIYTKEKGRVACGLVIWAAGNKATKLVESLPVKKTKSEHRIATDPFLRIYDESSAAIDSAFALGDAADIEIATLPTTAEAACQKATYLAGALNKGFEKPFEYRQAAMVAYLGQHDGVIAGKMDYSGPQAWIAWRSKNFLWTRTWRQKVLVVVSWVLDLVSGRNSIPNR